MDAEVPLLCTTVIICITSTLVAGADLVLASWLKKNLSAPHDIGKTVSDMDTWLNKLFIRLECENKTLHFLPALIIDYLVILHL